MNPKNLKTSPKYFDVARPGQATPSSTSRPVVTGNRPVADDPLLHKPVHPPLKVPPQVAVPQPAPVAKPDPSTLDPAALLIQAGDFTPLKASKNTTRHVVLVAMILVVVLMCAMSYWLVSTM